MIQRRHYPKLSLIVHTVTGQLEEHEFRAAGIALYGMDPLPRLSLWDLSNASILQFTLNRIEAIQSDIAEKVQGREGGRTAVVAPKDSAFGIVRQYAAMVESFDLPFGHGVFRTIEEACTWLGFDVDQLDDAASRDPDL